MQPNLRYGERTVVAGLGSKAVGSPLGFSKWATQPLSDSCSASLARASVSPPCREHILNADQLRSIALHCSASINQQVWPCQPKEPNAAV